MARTLVDVDAAIASYVAELPEETRLTDEKLGFHLEYRGYRELLDSWASLRNSRQQLIGHSVRGEPLWMVEIGNPDAKKVSVVIAGIHPIEWIGIEAAYQLAAEHSVDPSPDRRVCFFPLVSPDGYRRVEGHLRARQRKWVRSNENGVDLNRNWPTHFKEKKGLIAGHNCSGPSACSEPEVAAVVETLDHIASTSEIDVALSLHSIGKMILMPWGGKWASPEAREEHLSAARAIKKRLGRYTIRQVSHWVPGLSFAHGMELDHLHQAYGATSLLVECTRGELGSFKPSVFVHPFRIFNPKRGRAEAERIARAVGPFVRGEL